MDSAKKSKIRTLFIILLLFLPLQYGYVGIVGAIHSEPWPAFVFPGFKNVHSTGNSILIEEHLFKAHFVNQGSTEEVRPQELFPALPLSQIPGFMRTHFQDAEVVRNFSDEAAIWLYRLSKDYFGDEIVQLEIVRRTNRYLKSGDGITFDSVLHEEIIPIPKPENE